MVFLFPSQASTCLSFTAGGTGGEYKHTLTANELTSHSHVETASTYGYSEWAKATADSYCVIHNYIGENYHGPNQTVNMITGLSTYSTTANQGDSQSHNNIQPYITTYIWKRVS